MCRASVEPDTVQQIVDPRITPAARCAGYALGQGNVFTHIEGRDQIEKLEDDSDIPPAQQGARPLGAVIDRRAGERDIAFIRCVDRGDTVEQGGFARSARAHDRDQFARIDVQRQALQNRNLLLAQLIGFYDAGNVQRRRQGRFVGCACGGRVRCGRGIGLCVGHGVFFAIRTLSI